MPLPDPLLVEIPEAKLAGYLLSPLHPLGRTKARWFLRQGYTADLLRDALHDLLRRGLVTGEEDTEYGKKFIVHGTLVTPRGVPATLVSVWMQNQDGAPVRLVTAYPD